MAKKPRPSIAKEYEPQIITLYKEGMNGSAIMAHFKEQGIRLPRQQTFEILEEHREKRTKKVNQIIGAETQDITGRLTWLKELLEEFLLECVKVEDKHYIILAASKLFEIYKWQLTMGAQGPVTIITSSEQQEKLIKELTQL